MILKVLTVVDSNIIRNKTKVEEIPEHGIKKYDTYDNDRFFSFSYIAKSNINAYGQLDHKTNEMSALSDVLENTNKSAILMRFIVVDSKEKNIYYDGNRKHVQSILNLLFDLENKDIRNVADYDELVKLTQLEIISTPTGNMSFNDINNPFEISDDLDGMFKRNSIEKQTYNIKFKREGAWFDKDKFGKLYEESKTGLNKITVEGLDKKGHKINLSSNFSKKIEILKDRSGWNDRVELKLSTVLKALLKELDYETDRKVI